MISFSLNYFSLNVHGRREQWSDPTSPLGALGSASRDQERVHKKKGFPVFCTDVKIITNLPDRI